MLLKWVPCAFVFHDLFATLKFVGKDIIVFDKFSYKVLHKYKRGDVVLLKSPTNPSKTRVGRIVGIDGDWGRIEEGRLERIPKGRCCIEFALHQWDDAGKGVYIVPLALLCGRAMFPKQHPCLFSDGTSGKMVFTQNT
ncbi:hypothetical protein M9435_000801 [Picochlorum sp. BPE23]|nr:hypothetical protein M9435_000801 [Picochlorum sp. BPE23]